MFAGFYIPRNRAPSVLLYVPEGEDNHLFSGSSFAIFYSAGGVLGDTDSSTVSISNRTHFVPIFYNESDSQILSGTIV